MNQRIRTVIVDDERLARQRVRRLLSREADIDVLGECASAEEASAILRDVEVDLLFLDIQMPQTDGFDLLASLEEDKVPVVVFVTAYDEYALKAFEVHAFDYLLKPFDSDRFARTLAAAREQVAKLRDSNSTSERLDALVAELRGRKKYPARIPVKSSGRIVFVRIPDIDWIEAADNYVCLHVGGETHLLRETMSALEKRLDPQEFARIHRSTIVNLDRVKELRAWFHGEYLVVLTDGTELNLSRSYRDRMLSFMER